MILWNGTVALVLTTVVSIHIGYSRTEMKKSINAQNKIEPANLPKTMVSHVLVLFRKNTPYSITQQDDMFNIKVME